MPMRSAFGPCVVVALLACATLLPAARVEARTTTNLGQRYEIAATLDLDAGTLDAVMTLTLTNRASVAIDHLNLSVAARSYCVSPSSSPSAQAPARSPRG